jgi:hypothetical protein
MRDVEIPEPAYLKCEHVHKVKETRQRSAKLFN